MSNIQLTNNIEEKGFDIIENIYSNLEIDTIISKIDSLDLSNNFGVREFLLGKRELTNLVLTDKLKRIVNQLLPKEPKIIKSIYFNKPPNSNWIVNWHQDLTINVDKKMKIFEYKNWRIKEERVIVQPNRELLENIYTIRIHLDECNIENGALKVIQESHKTGVVNIAEWSKIKNGKEVICEVGKGGILLMKPLTIHSSKRAENERNRRVIHIEFTDFDLPSGLKWKEAISIN